MLRTALVLTFVAILGALAASQSSTGGQASSQAAIGGGGPGNVMPPLAWPSQAYIAPTAQVSSGLEGGVRVLTNRELIRIRWGFDRSGVRHFSTQTVPVNGWPTATAFDAGSLYVAGKRSALSGNTFIEKWSIQYPSIPATGFEYAASFTSTVIFEKDRANQRNPRFLVPLQGTSGQYGLVQFGDSDRLFRIDLSSGSVNLLYTPAAVPALADKEYTSISSGEHLTLGYVYIYISASSPHREGNTLAFFDGDKDGTIDGWQLFDNASWNVLMSTPTDWIQFFN